MKNAENGIQMFRLKFAVIIAIGLSTSVYADDFCRPNDNNVVFYQHAKYSGDCVALGIGTYMNSAEMGLNNDSVSSIRVGRNVQAMVCKHAFKVSNGSSWFENPNNCQRLRSSKINLTGSRIGNDSISSVKIVVRQPVLRAPGRCYPGDKSRAVAVYQHPNLGGACTVLKYGNYLTAKAMNFENDSISSIEFGKDSALEIRVCRDHLLGGRCEIFSATDLNLSDNRIGDNTITSIRVGR